MVKSIAPTKLTGGGGFEFEDKVAAYFLSLLLSKRPPLHPSFGIITRIRFQVRADNWLLDDLLLTLDDATVQRNCALSIKSNAQFSQTSAPADFVRNAWEQYLETEGVPFTREQDRMGLITTPLPTETKVNIENLLSKARSQASDELYRHIQEERYVSKEAKDIFLSFRCPNDLSKKHSKDEKNIGELLSHLEHIVFDFEHTSSSRLNEALHILRETLTSNDLSEAKKLWDSLCVLARESRTHGGIIDLRSLVNRIKKNFHLTVFPDHEVFWEKVHQTTITEMALIPDKIAQTININRDSALKEIEAKLDANRIIVILGESGSGKTVIEKHFIQPKLNSSKIAWINKDTLPKPNDVDYLEKFKLIPDTTAYIILDGLDKYYDEMLKSVAALLNACSYADASSSWKFIISCQPEEWARVQNSLVRYNINPSWEIYKLEGLTYEELKPVWDAFPILEKLACHGHLQGFLFRPKVLDLFARRIHESGFDEKAFGKAFFSGLFVGESHLIDWYWEQEVEDKQEGLIRNRVLKTVSEKLADELILEVALSEFDSHELEVIEDLIKERTLCKRGDKITFEHDLIADWARLKTLQEKDTYASEFISGRLSSPLWCRALRLMGTYLLETTHDTEAWKSLFISFASNKEIGRIAQDLLLESSIFSSDPEGNLGRLWEELKQDDGKLLRRFLKRFLYTATFPSKLALMFAAAYQNEAVSDIVTSYRDPNWFYWIPVIRFLHAHEENVIRLASKDIADICDKWLRYSKDNWYGRSEAACIAIDIAEDYLALNMSNLLFYDRSGYSKAAYRAAIAACKEQPERVLDFVLTACSRKEPSGRILEQINKYNKKAKEEEIERRKKINKEALAKLRQDAAPLSLFHDEGPTPPPWPDGPKYDIDRDFHDLCVESESDADTLYPLIESFPDKAIEVILALFIEPPRPKDRDGHPLEEYTGLNSTLRWFPSFYTRGPFLFFMNKLPDKGMSLIIKLINFATDRWADKWREEGNTPPSITMEFPWGQKSYTGDALVYYWHRDVGSVSHIIASALMALEWWLYKAFENEESSAITKKSIERIINEGKSLSFIGLLVSLGKKCPELFTDQLLPLLSVPEFYSWSMEHILKSEGHQMISWVGKGEPMIKMAQEWNNMPHRKYDLMHIGPRIYLQLESTRSSFTKYREAWITRYKNKDFYAVSPEVLENLINWYDLSNWRIEETEEGIKYEYKMPDEIMQKRLEDQKEMGDRQALLALPINFRRILNGEVDPDGINAEGIWKAIEYVSTIELDKDDPEADILQKENAICGGIAVLFKLFRDWLKSNPDKENWCAKKITDLILNPLPDRSFDSEVSIAPWAWDRYCAEVMPLIWAMDTSNKLYRRCMAALALNKHYETVGILFRSTSELRRDLGKNFKQLVNFMVRWTHARWKFYRERYSNKKTFDIDGWLKNEAYIFEIGKTPHVLESWHDIAKEEMNRRTKLYEKEKKKRGRHWKSPRKEYFDLWLMKAALSWMPPLNQAINAGERAEWLLFWKQAISWTLSILETDEHGEISGTPSEWDRWIFEQIAIQILQMEDSENPEELWQPILELGAEGHYWIDDFLMELFVKGIGYEAVSANFIKRWKQILEYAFSSEKWGASKGRFWFYRNKLWCELLGMNYMISELWREDRESIVADMKPYYGKWAKHFLTDSESALYFIYFLQRPAAKNMILDALVWLNNASDSGGEAFFTDRHHNVQIPLANLLEVSWKKQKTAIRENTASYKAYMNLLRKLVDLQNPQAIEIQQNLHRAK